MGNILSAFNARMQPSIPIAYDLLSAAEEEARLMEQKLAERIAQGTAEMRHVIHQLVLQELLRRKHIDPENLSKSFLIAVQSAAKNYPIPTELAPIIWKFLEQHYWILNPCPPLHTQAPETRNYVLNTGMAASVETLYRSLPNQPKDATQAQWIQRAILEDLLTYRDVIYPPMSPYIREIIQFKCNAQAALPYIQQTLRMAMEQGWITDVTHID